MSTPTSFAGRRYRAPLFLVALGVVYGDIGTSPLYAIRECFYGPHAVTPTHDHVLGVLSLIFWALVIVISLKYLVFVLRADNHGEGGILALTALATPITPTGRSERSLLIMLGIFGAALLYGDGIITPAISVLGAMEGLSVATPGLQPYVVPITIVILIALFWFQSRGTAGIGNVFGPIMLLWFAVLAILGAMQIAALPGGDGGREPDVWRGIFRATPAGTATSCSARSSSWSPAAKRCTPTWATSARRPIRIDWFTSSCPRCC